VASFNCLQDTCGTGAVVYAQLCDAAAGNSGDCKAVPILKRRAALKLGQNVFAIHGGELFLGRLAGLEQNGLGNAERARLG